MSKSKKAAKSILIIIVFTFCSKALGFIREMLIAAKFGSGLETDTFFIALSTIALFTSLITKSINTTMIPVLSEIETLEGKGGKINHTSNLLNIVLILSFIITTLAWLLSPFILKLVAYGFEGEQFKFAVSLMRIGLPAILFSGIVGIFSGYLQSESMFTESAVAQFPFNFVYIFFLLFLTKLFGIKGLMVTSALAVGAQILIQLPGVKRTGFKYKLTIDIKDKYVKRIIYLIPPILISVGVSDLNTIIDRSLASTLVEGSISALKYADRLNEVITGIFISAITTVLFPMLSQEANKDTYIGLKRVIINGINIILLITIPATVGMVILSNPIVKIAFERGAFDSNATYMTVGALVFYTIGMVGKALNLLLNKVYYSLQDTKTPMINSFIAVVINIVLNFILINFMAHKGLALATSISAIVASILFLLGLRKKIGSFGLMKSLKCGLKSLFASVVMGVAVFFLYGSLEGLMGNGSLQQLIALIVSVAIGVVVYLVLIYIFKVEEMVQVMKVVKSRIGWRKA